MDQLVFLFAICIYIYNHYIHYNNIFVTVEKKIANHRMPFIKGIKVSSHFFMQKHREI